MEGLYADNLLKIRGKFGLVRPRRGGFDVTFTIQSGVASGNGPPRLGGLCRSVPATLSHRVGNHFQSFN